MEPLASYGKSLSQTNTNLSTSVSLTILDQNETEVSIQTTLDNPIEIIIPRDPNLLIPPMILQNVTSTLHNQSFDLHYVNITSFLPISVHFEIYPFDTNLSYLLIYKFDKLPLLNSSIQQMDGWILFCPSKNVY